MPNLKKPEINPLSALLNALLIGAIAIAVLLYFSVRNINQRNAEFQKQLAAPKGHLSPAFFDLVLQQVETHLQNARAGGNVRYELPQTGVLTLRRTRDRSGASGYALFWEERRSKADFPENLRTAAEAQGLPAEYLSKNKLEINFPDDYLTVETFIETACGALDRDDISAVLTWVSKGLQTKEDTAI